MNLSTKLSAGYSEHQYLDYPVIEERSEDLQDQVKKKTKKVVELKQSIHFVYNKVKKSSLISVVIPGEMTRDEASKVQRLKEQLNQLNKEITEIQRKINKRGVSSRVPA